jgi:Na+-transporting methylmalonyl-CoA/oxaloacetate decarboxylase gamma subunit
MLVAERTGKATKIILLVLVMILMSTFISSCKTENAETSEAYRTFRPMSRQRTLIL